MAPHVCAAPRTRTRGAVFRLADRPAGSHCGLGLHVYEGLADARNHRLAAQRALGGEGLLQRGGARLREALALVRRIWDLLDVRRRGYLKLDEFVRLGSALCEEKPRGVFSRRWSNGVAALDCNTWRARLPFA